MLKHYLTDLILQYDTNTNILPPQPQFTPDSVLAQGFLDSHLDRFLPCPSPIVLNTDLIDQLINLLMLSLNLKALATSLS